jgi:predicted transcriptional regulator
VNYRDKLDIIADILTVASKNAKRTQIMYQANLSYRVLVKYLEEVVASSLIAFQDDQQYYVLTEKGKEFLVAYKNYVKSSKHVEKRLDEVRKQKGGLEELCKNSAFEQTNFAK